MGLLKIHEAINTWIVSNELDERLHKFKCLSIVRQGMVHAMVEELYREEMRERSQNVVQLKAVNE